MLCIFFTEKRFKQLLFILEKKREEREAEMKKVMTAFTEEYKHLQVEPMISKHGDDIVSIFCVLRFYILLYYVELIE